MTTFDKVTHMVGTAASGVLVAGLSGGIAVPGWLMITAVAVQFATGATSGAMVKPGSLFTPKPDKRGQIADAENPK